MTDAATATPRSESWLRNYLAAVHVGRFFIGAMSLIVAYRTRDEIPTEIPWTIVLAWVGLAWVVAVAAAAPRLWPLLERRPGLIWVDTTVLVGLMLLDRPVDSLAALPYGAFGLMVPFVAPRALAAAVGATVVLGYLPRQVALALDWRFADLVPPTNTIEWLSLYVGPLFAGAISVALATMMRGVRAVTVETVAAEAAAASARVRRAEAQVRIDVANRVHTSASSSVRAIGLRMSGPAPGGLDGDALAARDRVIAEAARLRNQLSRVSREVRG